VRQRQNRSFGWAVLSLCLRGGTPLDDYPIAEFAGHASASGWGDPAFAGSFTGQGD